MAASRRGAAVLIERGQGQQNRAARAWLAEAKAFNCTVCRPTTTNWQRLPLSVMRRQQGGRRSRRGEPTCRRKARRTPRSALSIADGGRRSDRPAEDQAAQHRAVDRSSAGRGARGGDLHWADEGGRAAAVGSASPARQPGCRAAAGRFTGRCEAGRARSDPPVETAADRYRTIGLDELRGCGNLRAAAESSQLGTVPAQQLMEQSRCSSRAIRSTLATARRPARTFQASLRSPGRAAEPIGHWSPSSHERPCSPCPGDRGQLDYDRQGKHYGPTAFPQPVLRSAGRLAGHRALPAGNCARRAGGGGRRGRAGAGRRAAAVRQALLRQVLYETMPAPIRAALRSRSSSPDRRRGPADEWPNCCCRCWTSHRLGARLDRRRALQHR